MYLLHLLVHPSACRNDNQVNNRKVILLSQQGDVDQQQEVTWKDVVAGDLLKVTVKLFGTAQHSAMLCGSVSLQALGAWVLEQ